MTDQPEVPATDQPEDPAGAKRMSAHFSAAVTRLRAERRMPYRELSERLAALGTPIPIMSIRRIEIGERRVDIDEIATFAKVFGVPPLLLILPVGLEPETEILPGQVRDTLAAARWFTGEGPLPSETQLDDADSPGALSLGTLVNSEDFVAWHTGGRPLDLARDHERLLEEWRDATQRSLSDVAVARAAEGKPQAEQLGKLADEGLRRVRDLEEKLLDLRRSMQREGWCLPYVKEFEPEMRAHLAEHGVTEPSVTDQTATVGDLEES